jgi:predicted transcriptional regulator
MARFTISLPDDLHRALKEAAVRRRQPIGDLIAESLDFYGIKTAESARVLVAKARKQSGMKKKEAQRLANAEVRADRRR